jgi:Zn-dependent protease with chaperone function
VSFVLLALALIFAVHLLVATALAGVVAATLPRLQARLRRLEPRDRAACIFGLGLLPAAGGLFAALGLALPSWLRHEPRGTGEEAGPVLLALALAGAVLVVGRLGSALRDQWQTSRLVRRWTAEGRALSGLPFEATRMRHELPVAALAGTLRPRLIFSDTLLRALSPAELGAVVEHERAHAAVHENLRRLLLRASPDPLALLAAGQRLRADFEAAAEAAADRAACTRVSPLLLAGALLKVAELVPEGRRLDLAMAALHREGGIAARVRALLAAHDARGEPVPNTSGFRAGRAALFLGAAAVVAQAAAPHPLVHRVLEALVHLS